MGKITKFEDLDSWVKARELVKAMFIECQNGELAKDYDTKSQLKRASLSIMNNIAEGFARRSSKEFIRFLDIAVSSAAEVKSMLYVLEDVNYFNHEKSEEYHSKINSIRNLILGLIRYINSRPKSYVKEEGSEYGYLINLDA